MKPDGEKFHSASGTAEASEPRAHFIAGDTHVPNVLGAEQILPKKVTAARRGRKLTQFNNLRQVDL